MRGRQGPRKQRRSDSRAPLRPIGGVTGHCPILLTRQAKRFGFHVYQMFSFPPHGFLVKIFSQALFSPVKTIISLFCVI